MFINISYVRIRILRTSIPPAAFSAAMRSETVRREVVAWGRSSSSSR